MMHAWAIGIKSFIVSLQYRFRWWKGCLTVPNVEPNWLKTPSFAPIAELLPVSPCLRKGDRVARDKDL